MTPAARIKAVIDILTRLQEGRVPMDTIVGDYMRVRRYVGSKDRSFIAEAVYDMMRHHARIGFLLNKVGAEDSILNRVLCYLAVVEKRPRIHDLFDGSRYGADELNEQQTKDLEKFSALSLDDPSMPVTLRTETPDHYAGSLQNYFGKDFEDEMSAFLNGAGLDVRVNTVLAPLSKVKDYLAADNVEVDALKYSPFGFRIKGKTFLSKTKAFSKGWIDIQDEGSQLIALACDVRPGMQVLDYCAGAGGKTLALANMMQVKGRIVAMDTEERRLEKGRERFRRARVSDIIELRPLSDERHRKWLKRQDQSFDVVLTDVPCTGTGTWRRNPDMRWFTYGPSLAELCAVQADILDRVVHVVKPLGRLVYATCSLLPEENEEQVAAFLKRHDDFELLPLSQGWPEGVTPPCAGDVMRLTPHRHGTDGFFAAILQRKG
jgi:16S rRNA (cytosine967-C5)-methyltransferase